MCLSKTLNIFLFLVFFAEDLMLFFPNLHGHGLSKGGIHLYMPSDTEHA